MTVQKLIATIKENQTLKKTSKSVKLGVDMLAGYSESRSLPATVRWLNLWPCHLFQPPPSASIPNGDNGRPDVLDPGAANTEDGWLERKAEARHKFVHFHISWSPIKYLSLQGKSNSSTKIGTIYHQ